MPPKGKAKAKAAVAVPRPETLDTSLSQLVVHYEGDKETPWYHIVLLVQLGTGSGDASSRWVALNPDLELETLDLASRRVVPL